MRKVLLITLSLVLALAGWTTVCADDGFYVIAGQKAKYAPVPKTGQTTSYFTRDDGALQKGVAWPTPRFTDNGNGTVTDKFTGLIWMKNAQAFPLKTWEEAISAANALADGSGGLSDGSKAGDWRLPNVRELQSLVDYGHNEPALPLNHPFNNVISSYYWSSTTGAFATTDAWNLHFSGGTVSSFAKTTKIYVWCVRGGP
jgi:hypothetical protein